MFQELAITTAGILPFYLALIAVFTREYQERFSKLLRLFLVSGMTTVPFFVMKAAGIDPETLSSLFGPLFSVALLAFSEELVKSIALFFDKELKKHLYYPILVGLGFAFFENISYLIGFDASTSFVMIAIIRLFLGSTAHAVFTSLVAHIMNKGLHKTRTFYYLLGLMVAGSFHTFFNLLHHWEMSYMTIPLLVILLVYLHFDHSAVATPKAKKRHHGVVLAKAQSARGT